MHYRLTFKSCLLLIVLFSLSSFGMSNKVPEPKASAAVKHVWEKIEITLYAENDYNNPYTDVEVWVDLRGPGFNKRCFGFWDGGNVFKVRILATRRGVWTWQSWSNQKDSGLNNIRGKFRAVKWTEEQLKANPVRRGHIKASKNGHAFEYADGRPCFILGDTWWSTATFRYPWYDDDKERPIGPKAGFKDYVRFRKKQGFNCIGMIAGFPNWATDDKPARIWIDEKRNLGVRAAWINQDKDNLALGPLAKAKDMHNEGGRVFMFPGKVPGYENNYPDMDRINPEYFKYMDRKVDHLNSQGFIPFIEVSRRDASSCWAEYYDWPESYTRYIQYIWSRYQANSCLYSPIHYDWRAMAVKPEQFNEAANLVIEKYGRPPFGTLVSCNSSPSSLINFGGADKAKWLTFHQIGNWREHEFYRLLTEIYNSEPPKPGLNGEPYYAGYNDKTRVDYKYGAPGGTETDDLYVRSSMYGSFLSGGFAGHIYGSEALWGADIEPGSNPYMWEAFKWNSANQMQHLRTFALSQGKVYQELVPSVDLIGPNRKGKPKGYLGWAYCARTDDKKMFMLYFEKECPGTTLRGALANREYNAKWFDTRTGKWRKAGSSGKLRSDENGKIVIPVYPSDNDWALTLTALK